MMMSDDKKKRATLILAKLKGPNMEKEEEQEMPKSEDGTPVDSSIGLDAASEEIMAAIDSKNPKALKEALVSLVEMLMSERED